jgi:hypothetical protein
MNGSEMVNEMTDLAVRLASSMLDDSRQIRTVIANEVMSLSLAKLHEAEEMQYVAHILRGNADNPDEGRKLVTGTRNKVAKR